MTDNAITPDGPGHAPTDIDVSAVAALLFTPDGRYLMQRRDERPEARMAGHWGAFGGQVDERETPREALIRELHEELSFTTPGVRWFTEILYCLHQVGRRFHRKYFFEVPVTPADIARMTLNEGAEMRLFTFEELAGQPRVVPWDCYGVMLHARRNDVFESYLSARDRAK
jgi:8-oxo-dGTP pyrophosphatase MutT (NUDIX family)